MTYVHTLKWLLTLSGWEQHRAELLAQPELRTAALNCHLQQVLPVLAAAVEAAAAAGPSWEAVQPVSTVELSPAAWVVIRLVPYMARTLRAVAADGPAAADDACSLVNTYNEVLQLLGSVGRQRTWQVGSWEQLSAWAEAADAGLRMLATLAEAISGTRQQDISSMLQAVVALLGTCGAQSAAEWCESNRLQPTDSRQALAAQLWQLHSTAARLVHMSAGGVLAPVHPEVRQAWPVIQWLLLSNTFLVAYHLLSNDAAQERDQRWQALCAAQLEALQAEHVAPASWAFQLVVMLTVVARDCPFLVGPAFAAVLQRMVHSSQEQERWLRSLPDVSQVSASVLISNTQPLLAPAAALAPMLREHWAQPEQVAADRLALARAAAARSCAYLRCANLGGEGGPAAGQGVGSQRCSACRAMWYCGTACSHADWREGGHRRVCRALAQGRGADGGADGAAGGSAAGLNI
ncbi:hypothetical protein C2E21_4658 [Chlorella sorokiniana]|uniref:MYND-type domain-containing protein n=1 Tax=Chlorella sorokiniana TaxID=3076 RepID=A0A2P6TRZ3_CHLSO|nr:hypothetical protein C2E21_4658 [Chlorella sorokiniana]|eukprot:PRW56827.1 hypothetical protein C2E21_4658 [Chlorella sorokiniana]